MPCEYVHPRFSFLGCTVSTDPDTSSASNRMELALCLILRLPITYAGSLQNIGNSGDASAQLGWAFLGSTDVVVGLTPRIPGDFNSPIGKVGASKSSVDP